MKLPRYARLDAAIEIGFIDRIEQQERMNDMASLEGREMAQEAQQDGVTALCGIDLSKPLGEAGAILDFTGGNFQ